MSQANWLDRAIAAVAPQRAEKRLAARNRIARMSTARNIYEAASLGRRTQGWRRVSTDANAENRYALRLLRDAARDMVRNNAYAFRAKSVIRHNVVGAGILPQVRAAQPERQKEVNDLLRHHFDTTDIDADGRTNLYGLQSLIIGTVVEAGEVLIRKRIRRSTDGYALPFQLQVLEPDYLDTSYDGPLASGNVCIQGVEFDQRGKRVAYYLYDQHPGSIWGGSTVAFRGRRVSADFVAHVYRVDRPGQVRGVTWFAPVMVRMRDWADYADAALMRQKIAACYGAFITTEDNFDAEAEIAGNGVIHANDGLSPYPVEEMEPGMVERLQPGESISFATPPGTQDFGPYSSVTLHEVASGLNVPYEAMTSDLSEVSFISGRLGRIEFRSSVDDWRWNMLMPQAMGPLASWVQEAVAVATGSSEPFRLGWTPPRWEMLDPAAEVAASSAAVRNGFSWRSEELRARGLDPAEWLEGMIADNSDLDAHGIVLDSDPRTTTLRGAQQKTDNAKLPDALAP